ncbi:choice-of-anchor J domain-containing protein, partial [Flavobacteriales bacterium]|nr:choice-of-anchor J domain-containing protein [Flavobacteriales bacterium]
ADKTICAGESVTLSGSGAVSYTWDNGITDNTAFVPSATTTYTVTGTDGAGCIGTDDVVVTVNSLPTVSAGADQIVCVGTSVTLAGSGAVTYNWDNGITDNTPFFVSATTTYSVTGTDANSCSATDDIKVTVTAIGDIYVDDFESQGSWTGDFGNTNGSWNITSGPTTSLSTGPSGAHSGNKYFYFETSAGGLNNASIVSPAINLTSLNDATVLSFWLHAYGVGIGTLNVGISTSPTGGFTNIYTISNQQTSSSSDPFQKISVDITAYNGQTVYLQLNHVRTTSGGTSWEGDLAVDLLEVKSCVSCIAPTNINVASITQNSADISWTAGGTETAWNLEYGPKGFSQSSGTTVNLNATNYTFTSLDASTIYSYYLQSNCGSEQSVWLGPYDFQTTIAAPNGITCISGTNNFNLNSGFEMGAPGWTTVGSGWATSVSTGNSTLSGPASAHQGTQWAGFDAPTFSNNTGSLISPSVDLINSLNSAELSFYLHAFGTNNGTLDVGVSNDISGPFTKVFTWSGAIQTANTNSWTAVGVDLTTYVGQQIYISFDYSAHGEGDIGIDLVKVETCTDPTYVPDDNFEAYLETHDASGNVVSVGDASSMGDGIANNDYVTTANISGVTSLDVDNQNIADLTGIEDFTSLTNLICYDNQLTNLDVSQNIALKYLEVQNMQLTSLDVSHNTSLEKLHCFNNPINSLDVSQNTVLNNLRCYSNQLTSLDVRNGNNTNFTYFAATNNPNLNCISVDDATWATVNWTNIDSHTSFSPNCDKTYVPDDNFEAYLETHDASGNVVSVGDANAMGDGIANNDSVTTANISGVTSLDVDNQNIAGLNGIEDFTSLTNLICYDNQLASLDVSQNIS